MYKKRLMAGIMSATLIMNSLTVYADNITVENQAATGVIANEEISSQNEATDIPANIGIESEEKNVKITWDKVQNATAYNVYRSTGKYSTYEKVATVDTNKYEETVTTSVYDYYYKITSVDAESVESEMSEEAAMDIELFGDSVNLFSQTDNVDQINSTIKAISDIQTKASMSEFTDKRYALMFKPGDYDIDTIQVGFYTQVLGLGATPHDVSINNINISASDNGNSLINFWRGIENITVDAGSPNTEVKWAASQAAPVRRLYVNGKLHFDDLGNSASGGFLADTYVTGQTGSWSQQQFMIRNTSMTRGWYDGVWNIMFVGSDNAPANTKNWANSGYQSYTTVDETPVIKEKPFLYINDDGEYAVFVPGTRINATGISWAETSMGEGTSISIDDFYVAKPDVDTAETINAAIDEGKHLIFTPGVYSVTEPINVQNENTVVLGLGIATIICYNTETAFKVADKDGITIAGIIIEAGANESNTLIQVGDAKNKVDHSDNPILLSDVFCRVGGARIGKTKICVEINSNDVIGDHFWLWRADHGAGANWTQSTADHGIVVNGDNVTIYGLFVEHFQKYQTLWNGENGSTYFYQSELPYDVPYQSDWMSNDGKVNGYASYKVADSVKNHKALALGIYEVFINTRGYIKLDNAIEVSSGTKVTNACTVSLGHVNGEISSIVNGFGGAVGSHGISGHGAKKGINSYPDDNMTSNNGNSSGNSTNTNTSTNSNTNTNTSTNGATTKVEKPAKAKITKLYIKKKALNIKIKKVAGATGYKVQIATTKKFKKKITKYTTKTKLKIKKVNKIKKLKKAKKYYYVRVKAYKVVNGKKVYSKKWSKVKKVKVKK